MNQPGDEPMRETEPTPTAARGDGFHTGVDDPHHTRVRKALWVTSWDGVLATACENAGPPFAAIYALALGAGNVEIGLLAALPALAGNVLQLPAAALGDRIGRRKLLVLISGFSSRLLWLPILLIPFLFTGRTAFILFLSLMVLRSALGALGAPAWTSLVADIAPRRLRGNYFANRTIYCNVAALIATLVAGWLIKHGGNPWGFVAVFAGSLVTGVGASLFFSRLPEPPEAVRKARQALAVPLRERLQLIRRQLKNERNFSGFTLSSLIWTFAVTMPGPLFVIYFVKVLGGDANDWGIVTAATMIATMFGQRYWGRLVGRLGEKNVMVVSGAFVAFIPLFWCLIGSPTWAIAINLFGGLAWAGYNLAAFNLLLQATPDGRRQTFVAAYNAGIGLSSAAAPIIGTLLSGLMGIKLVLLLSCVGRYAALAAFSRLVQGPPRRLDWRLFVPRLPGLHRRSYRQLSR
ncbi:MAG TPA: MFS transporter [Limnochordia bacterium]|nr:MFS transporter [Limnochordia bacterium]